MRALTVTPKVPNSAKLVQLPDPKPGADDVLVRVLQVGVCGTDKEILAGLYGEAPPGEDSLILGHESFGQVQQVGRNVASLRVGDYVVATVRRPDDCLNCQRGETDMCLKGNYTERGIKGQHGYMANYYCEKPEYLIKVPEKLRHVGVLAEPLSIVEKAAFHIFQIQKRLQWEPRRGLVLGAGPIGILAAAVLVSRGLETFAAATTPEDRPRVQVLKRMGIAYLNVHEVPIADMPARLGNIDVIVEATGSSSVAFEAMSILGVNGVLCLTGVSAGNKEINIPTDCLNLGIVLGNKTIFGTVNANKRDWQRAIQDMALFETLWPGALSDMITRRVPLEDFAEAVERKPYDIKAVLEI